MIALALLAVLLDGVISVPASGWKTFPLQIETAGSRVEGSLSVPRDASHVQLLILTPEQARYFRRGRGFKSLFSSGYRRAARFAYTLPQKGSYVALLDNRLEGRAPAEVALKIELHPPPAVVARTLAPEKRTLVVALSFFFVGAVTVLAAWIFLRQPA